MAGIILDLNGDIEKLQQLKNKIEEVKKALTSVNIKVDMVEGLEAQLKSLTEQYNQLVMKIADAEGKIMASTDRINKASEKIIQAQERLAKSAGGTKATQGSTASDKTTTDAQTASVEAQAKAYDELAGEIDAIMGTRSQNIKRMVEEQNAIRLIKQEITELTKYQGQGSTLSSNEQRRLEQLNASLMQHKTALSELRQSLANSFRLDNAAATSMNALSQSLARMRMTYRELTEEERNSPFGKELLASIQQADAKIKELDATIGNHQRNVGNYSSGFNSLGMSVQQIVRELPSATMGLNMFFLAISNNLPILTDEIKRAVELNKQMKAQNQATIPVWKQLVSSIFSWQTALIVAITAMSMYGKEIVNWISNLIKGKDEVNALRQEQEALNAEMKNARAEGAKEAAQLRILYAMTQNTNASMKDRIAAVKQLQSQYPAYFGNLSQEAILAGQASAAYQQLAQDIIATAYARAYKNRIEMLAAENVEEIRGSRADFNYMQRNRASYNSARKYLDSERGIYAYSQYSLSQQNRDNVQIDYEAVAEYTQQLKIATEYEERRARWQRHNTAYKQREVQMQEYENEVLKRQSALMKTTQGSSYTEDAKNDEKEAERRIKENEKLSEQRKKAQEELNKDLLSLQQQNQDDEIALMKDGTQKRLAEIKNDYKKRIAEIDKQEAEFKKKNQEAGATGLTGGLTKEQQTALQEARDNAAKEQRKQVKEVVDEENDTRIAALQNYLKEYGDYEQKRLAITEGYNKKIADAVSQVEKTSLQAELEKTLSELDFNEFKDKFNWEDIFGNLGDLTLKQLEGIRAQLRTLLADGSLGVDEYKTVVEQIGKVNEAIISEQDKLKDTFGLILPMAEERRKLELDVAEANARQNELLAEQQELLNGIETKRQDITTALQNAGLDINASDVNIGNQDAILSQLEGIFGPDSDIYKNVSKSFDELNKSERDLNNTTQKLDKAQADATSAQSKLNKFLSDFGNKLQAVNEIMSLVSSNMQSLPDLFSQLGVDMDSAFGKGITDLANASQNATSAMQDAMSGNFVGALSNGIGAVKGVLSGFNNILGLGIGQGNAKETMERIDRLTESNDYLRTSIDRLTEKMNESAGGRAIDYYQQAADAQERMNENYRDILDSSMRYTGAHHSNAYYWNLDDNSLKQVNALLGTSLTDSWDDFSKLTAEQMDEIRTHLPDIWEEMINQGKYGGDRFRDAWEDYADQAGKVEELTEQINENLTQTSFGSLRSNFLDTLMDMDADAQDFADDFNEMMQRALLNFAMGDMLDDQLKEWYNSLAETISNNNGKLSQGDIESLRDEWQGMVDEWLDMRDTISEITGYKGSSSSTQQSASSKGFETMSQDTGDAINGRMTAIYEAELRITDITTEQLAVLKAIYGQMGGNIADVASESKQILSTSYIQQNNISFPTAQLDALVAKVEGLDAKVADLVSFGADNRLSMQGVDTYIEDATKNSTKSLSLLNDIKRNTQGL